jgi:hypothetical protein
LGSNFGRGLAGGGAALGSDSICRGACGPGEGFAARSTGVSSDVVGFSIGAAAREEGSGALGSPCEEGAMAGGTVAVGGSGGGALDVAFGTPFGLGAAKRRSAASTPMRRTTPAAITKIVRPRFFLARGGTVEGAGRSDSSGSTPLIDVTGAAAGVSTGNRPPACGSAGGRGAIRRVISSLLESNAFAGGAESVSMMMSSSSSLRPLAMTTFGSLGTGRSLSEGVTPMGAAAGILGNVGCASSDGGIDGGMLSASAPSISKMRDALMGPSRSGDGRGGGSGEGFAIGAGSTARLGAGDAIGFAGACAAIGFAGLATAGPVATAGFAATGVVMGFGAAVAAGAFGAVGEVAGFAATDVAGFAALEITGGLGAAAPATGVAAVTGGFAIT